MTTVVNTSLKVRYEDEIKIVKVHPGAIPGPKGDSPDRSIYSARHIDSRGPTLEIDASQATTFFITIHMNLQNLTVINWPNDSKSQRIALYFQQDEFGARNVINWPPNTRWSFSQKPILTTKPHAIDCFILDTFDRGENIFAGIVGLDYA